MSNSQQGTSRIRWGLGEWVVFVIPCMVFIEVKLVGRLFLPEMILLVLFPFLLLNRGRILLTALPKTLIVLGLLWLTSQVVTDIIRSTPFEDFSRGWSNIGAFLIEFAAIYLLVIKSEKRLIIFALGIVIGQLLQYFIAPNIYAAGGEFWKFGIGYAITFLLIIGTQLHSVSRRTYLAPAILLGAAVLNFVMEARSLGGICFITALYLIVQSRAKSNQPITTKVSIKKLFLSVLILLVSGVVVLKFYGLVAGSGILGESTQQKYESQAGGKFGLLIGGRQELLVSSLAIIDSPIIGHGSWAKDQKYLALLPQLLLEYGYDDTQPIAYDGELSGLIPTHSFLFGAWVNSGLLGAIFWFWAMVFCAKLLLVMYKTKHPLIPVAIFVGFNMLWNILFSPFGAETRLYTAYYLVLLMFMHNRLLIKQAVPLSKEVGSSTRIQATKQILIDSMMRISVVTISFNQARFLKAAIDSIVSQGYRNLEYVVVDPGSTDGSRDVLKQYGDQICKSILEPDAGPADGLNKGFASTSGEILGFVNADDELLPHSLQFVADYFVKYPDVDILLGSGWIVDDAGEVLRHIVPSRFSLLHYAFGRFEFIQQAAFFRKSVFESIGGFNISNRISWDGELLVDMVSAGARIARTEKELGVFRIYPSSISGSVNYMQKLLLEQTRLFQKIMGRGSRWYDPVLSQMLLASKWILDPWYVYWKLTRNFRIKTSDL